MEWNGKKLERKKIGELTPGSIERATYIRNDGKTYCLLTRGWCVEVSIKEDGRCIGKGKTEPADPDEIVDVIRDGYYEQPKGPKFRNASGVEF